MSLSARATAALIALSCIALPACGPAKGVGSNGQYTFTADAPLADTAPYPLKHLVMLEQDDDRGVALVYLFSGQLGAAGLGLPDLRRLARNFGNFEMAFQVPHARYTQDPLEGELGLQATLPDGTQTLLHQLSDDSLQPSGASRFLTVIKSDDYDVRAYFGAIEYDGELPPFSIDLAPGTLEITPQLATAQLTLQASPDALTLDYGTSSADYLNVDLLQQIANKDMPDDAIEALVRTSFFPGTTYQVGSTLLSSAADQGCWSNERPLQARVTQFFREYLNDPDGDRAVVQERSSVLEIDNATWSAFATEPQPVAYCDQYQAPSDESGP